MMDFARMYSTPCMMVSGYVGSIHEYVNSHDIENIAANINDTNSVRSIKQFHKLLRDCIFIRKMHDVNKLIIQKYNIDELYLPHLLKIKDKSSLVAVAEIVLMYYSIKFRMQSLLPPDVKMSEEFHPFFMKMIEVLKMLLDLDDYTSFSSVCTNCILYVKKMVPFGYNVFMNYLLYVQVLPYVVCIVYKLHQSDNCFKRTTLNDADRDEQFWLKYEKNWNHYRVNYQRLYENYPFYKDFLIQYRDTLLSKNDVVGANLAANIVLSPLYETVYHCLTNESFYSLFDIHSSLLEDMVECNTHELCNPKFSEVFSTILATIAKLVECNKIQYLNIDLTIFIKYGLFLLNKPFQQSMAQVYVQAFNLLTVVMYSTRDIVPLEEDQCALLTRILGDKLLNDNWDVCYSALEFTKCTIQVSLETVTCNVFIKKYLAIYNDTLITHKVVFMKPIIDETIVNSMYNATRYTHFAVRSLAYSVFKKLTVNKEEWKKYVAVNDPLNVIMSSYISESKEEVKLSMLLLLERMYREKLIKKENLNRAYEFMYYTVRTEKNYNTSEAAILFWNGVLNFHMYLNRASVKCLMTSLTRTKFYDTIIYCALSNNDMLLTWTHVMIKKLISFVKLEPWSTPISNEKTVELTNIVNKIRNDEKTVCDIFVNKSEDESSTVNYTINALKFHKLIFLPFIFGLKIRPSRPVTRNNILFNKQERHIY